MIVDEDNNYLSSNESDTKLFEENMTKLFDNAFTAELESTNLVFEMAEILSKEGGNMRITALSKKLSENHPKIDKIFMRRSFIQAQQMRLFMLDQEPDIDPNAPLPAPGQVPFNMGRMKATGTVRLNPALGYELF